MTLDFKTFRVLFREILPSSVELPISGTLCIAIPNVSHLQILISSFLRVIYQFRDAVDDPSENICDQNSSDSSCCTVVYQSFSLWQGSCFICMAKLVVLASFRRPQSSISGHRFHDWNFFRPQNGFGEFLDLLCQTHCFNNSSPFDEVTKNCTLPHIRN